MPKAPVHRDQLGFSFEPPKHSGQPGSLAGLERQICEAVGTILNSDPRRREVIAAEMSVQLDVEITRPMLDAWSSPARSDHRVSLSRFLALVAVCQRLDVLDEVLRTIGASALRDDELKTAKIGQLRLKLALTQRELRALEADAPLIRGGKEA